MSRFVIAVAVVLLALFPAVPSIAQPAGFGETVEVRLGTIDVVVTQPNGLSAIGLLPQDFELLIDGKVQEITGFDEVRESRQATRSSVAATPSAQPRSLKRPRHVVVFVDLYSVPFQIRKDLFRSVRRMLDKTLQEGDQVMIATWNRTLSVPLTFTADRALVDRQLQALEAATGTGLAMDRQTVRTRVNGELQFAQSSADYGYPRAYEGSIRAARTFAEEQLKLTKNLSASIQEVMKGMAGADGRKIMLFLGENLPQLPGLDMLEYVNETFNRYFMQGITPVIPQRMAQSDWNLTAVRREIAATANEHGVTFYAIYSGQSLDESAIERTSDGIASEDAKFRNTAGQISAVAEDTGGMALIGSRNYDLTADTIAQDLSSYYTLAWNATGQAETARIEVRTKKPGLRVRTRKAFGGKTLDEEIGDRVLTRLYQTDAKESRLTVVRLGTPQKARRGTVKVPVEILFPSSILTLINQDGKLVGQFDVVVAAVGGKGNAVSEVSRQSQSISWTEGSVPEIVSYKFEVLMKDQPSTVSVGVVDSLSKTALYRRAKFDGKS